VTTAITVLAVLCLISWALTFWAWSKVVAGKAEASKLRAHWEARRLQLLEKLRKELADATFDQVADAVDRGLRD
jgi:hypothetical protein